MLPLVPDIQYLYVVALTLVERCRLHYHEYIGPIIASLERMPQLVYS